MNERTWNRRAAAFDSLVSDAERLAAKASYEEASVAAARAAEYAWRCPFGRVTEPRLDAVLRDAGRLIASSERELAAPERAAPERVLHIATKLMSVGGHTRILQRWIEGDAGRRHDLVLTSQLAADVPAGVADAVRRSGGTLDDVSHLPLLGRARQIASMACDPRFCVVNQDPADVVPSLALGGARHTAVLLVDHADHVFWLGGMIADAVAHLRPRGRDLGRDHRGLPTQVGVIVPIPLDPPPQSGDRSEARRALGISDHELLLLSVASDYKFRSDGSAHFLDAIDPLLSRHAHVKLLVIGPEQTGRWADAVRRHPGRVSVPGPQPNIAEALLAADLYVDSYPLPSFTSALQAARLGVPTITRAAPRGASSYLEFDDPLVREAFTWVQNAEHLTATLSRWILDPEDRRRAGDGAALAMDRISDPALWREALERAYAQASRNRALPEPSAGTVRDVPHALVRAIATAHHQGRVDGAFVNVVGRSPDVRGVSLRTRVRVLYRTRRDTSTWRSWARVGSDRARGMLMLWRDGA